MALEFLKKGAASAQLAKKQEAEAQAYRESQGKMFRFWLKEKEEARITFIDGDLTTEGYLQPPRYYEHNLYLNGSWMNFFVCPEKTMPETASDPCPICQSGDRPSLVALFTVLDHRTTHSKDKTKTYKDQKRLLVAKPQTFEILNKIGGKRAGLACATFDVSRVGDKSAGVGSMFDFVEKRERAELEKMFMVEKTDPTTNTKKKVTNFTVADYEKEISYRSSMELRALGLGKPDTMTAPASGMASTPAQTVDYSKEL